MLFDITIAPFSKGLGNLSLLLDKVAEHAAAKKFDPEVLLQSRLVADQLNFTKQVQIACDTAKLGVARLTGKDAPKHDDSEKTVADLKARIQQTIDYLATYTAADFAGAEERKISQPRWEGKWMTGKEFALHHAIPNFYFHIATAYSILRKNGVDIGKKNYLGEMPYKS